MIIEDYWEDREIYQISFKNKNNMVYNRYIILPMDYGNKEKIIDLIFMKFNNIQDVISVDKWEEALELKL